MLVSELLETSAEILSRAGVDSPVVDAELIACHVLEIKRSELTLLIVNQQDFPASKIEAFDVAIKRRAQREPLQHITGIGPFRYLELEVGKGVFTPRPETEQVVSYALSLIADHPSPLVVDLCSGSGAIAISVATEVEGAKVFAVEKSPEAFSYLKRNFEKYGLDTAKLRAGDLAEHLDELIGTVDLVISNPPYIPAAAIPVGIEVQLHEPKLALYAGEDGLDVIRVISKRALKLLRPGGTLVLEHADTQAKAISELLLADGWEQVFSRKDLNNRDRMISAKRP